MYHQCIYMSNLVFYVGAVLVSGFPAGCGFQNDGKSFKMYGRGLPARHRLPEADSGEAGGPPPEKDILKNEM